MQVGDTLNSVAYKQKTNTRLLRKVNNVLTDNLLPGEVLLVPSILDRGQEDVIEKRYEQFTIRTR